jgi:hypothetical protein
MNTFKDDPTKGLSSLQKNILAWAHYKSVSRESELVPLLERPSFRKGEHYHYKHPIEPRLYSKSNVAAFSRALRSLEQRGLLDRCTGGSKIFHPVEGKTNWISLTDKGKELGKQLFNTITYVGWNRSKFESSETTNRLESLQNAPG